MKQFFDFCDYDNTKTLKIEELNHILGIDIKKDKKTYACFKKIARKDNVLNFEEFYEFFNLLLDKK